MDLTNRKFLVTGGAGFIGSHTVDALIRNGAEAVIIDNLATGRKKNLNPKAKFYCLNIVDPQVEEVFRKERPEFIYHFAFNVLVPEAVDDPLIDMHSIAGSINILKCAKIYKVNKIIFSSSGFLYGNTRDLPVKESAPIDYVSPYVVSKNTVENYIRCYNSAYGLPYVILRYSAVYGPRQVTGAMADYIRKLKTGKQAKIWGDGGKTRDYVYIDDVIHVNLQVLDLSPDFPDPIFNIGTGIETTLNDLYRKIAQLLNREPKPVYLPDRPGEQLRYCLDSSKIKRALGWEPRVNLDVGLRRRLGA